MSQCNRCRREFGPDDERVKGQHTPAVWCLPCAEMIGIVGPGVEDFDLPQGLDKRKLAAAFPEFTAAMRALKAKGRVVDFTARRVGSE